MFTLLNRTLCGNLRIIPLTGVAGDEIRAALLDLDKTTGAPACGPVHVIKILLLNGASSYIGFCNEVTEPLPETVWHCICRRILPQPLFLKATQPGS